jgi:hypothetical protein
VAEQDEVTTYLSNLRQAFLLDYQDHERVTHANEDFSSAESEEKQQQIQDLMNRAIDEFNSRYPNQPRLLLPLLQDDNLMVRLYTALLMVKTYPQTVHPLLVDLAELADRPGVEWDVTHQLIRDRAQNALWYIKTGSWDGWLDAPNEFWR